jgi:drug/metabolite transporter (DMT)-like permease
MPPLALALLLCAAVLHTAWNLLLKQSGAQLIISWWALLVSAFAFFPLMLLGEPLPSSIWPYALASAAAEALYFVALAAAYNKGDFSLVYPIARGGAPVLLLLWAGLFLQEQTTAVGIGGVLVIVLGIVVSGSGVWRQPGATGGVGGRSIALALLIALCISIYTAIDAAAVRQADPQVYIAVVFGLTALLVTPMVLYRFGRRQLVEVLRARWWQVLLISALLYITYGMVLAAYTLAPVSYAGAVREVSIVFAALAGWRWLGEPFGAARVAGACLMLAGIIVLAI